MSVLDVRVVADHGAAGRLPASAGMEILELRV